MQNRRDLGLSSADRKWRVEIDVDKETYTVEFGGQTITRNSIKALRSASIAAW